MHPANVRLVARKKKQHGNRKVCGGSARARMSDDADDDPHSSSTEATAIASADGDATFEERLRAMAELLLAGVEGSTVIARMIDATEAFNTDCSLLNYVSRVRRMVLDADDPRRFHPDRAAALAAFRRRLGGTDVDAQCRARGLDFLASSLQRQRKIARLHRKRALCMGHPEVDELFRQIRLLPANMDSFHVPAAVADSCRRQGVRRTIRKNEGVLLVPEASAHLDRAVALLDTCSMRTSVSAIGFALLLVSGRRMAEIFNGRSRFSAGPNAQSAIFDGQLKRDDPQPYAIPLLCTFASFSRGWAVLLEKLGDARLSNNEVHTRYASNLNRAIKRKLFVPDASSHDCRRFYIRAVYEGYAYESETSYTFNRVAMAFLGHSSLEESLKYNTVRLTDFHHRFGERVPITDDAREPPRVNVVAQLRSEAAARG